MVDVKGLIANGHLCLDDVFDDATWYTVETLSKHADGTVVYLQRSIHYGIEAWQTVVMDESPKNLEEYGEPVLIERALDLDRQVAIEEISAYL